MIIVPGVQAEDADVTEVDFEDFWTYCTEQVRHANVINPPRTQRPKNLGKNASVPAPRHTPNLVFKSCRPTILDMCMLIPHQLFFSPDPIRDSVPGLIIPDLTCLRWRRAIRRTAHQFYHLRPNALLCLTSIIEVHRPQNHTSSMKLGASVSTTTTTTR